MPVRFITAIVILTISVCGIVLSSLCLGSYRIPVVEVVHLVLTGGDGSDPTVKRVVFDMRLRRALTAVAVGAVLGLSGAAMQSVLRNPLASPFTLGVQHAAALGAAVAMTALYGGTIGRFSLEIKSPLLVSSLAFLGAVAQTFFVLALCYWAGVSAYAVVLISIAMAFFVQAILSLLQYLFLNEVVVAALLFWTFGDVSRASWAELGAIALIALLLLAVLLRFSFDMDLLLTGDELAQSSGVKVKRCRLIVLLTCALATAVTVSFVGIIGFVGLIGGQMARLIVGWANRRVIPVSALLGAIVLSASDLLGRTILSPTVIPVGIMTSLVGVPLLIYLLWEGRHAQGARG